MQPAGSPEPPAAADGADLAHLKTRSRRLTAVAGLALAVAIVAATLSVGDYEGFGQIGRGGINVGYLPKVGEPAPDVTLTVVDRQGAPIARLRLSELRGHPVWLNFWGSWCPPCRAEMPEIQAAWERLQPQGLVWLAISLDEPAQDAARFAALNGATFPIVSDPARADTGRDYAIANFPTHILIDRDGVVREVVLAALDEEEIVEHAQRIL